MFSKIKNIKCIEWDFYSVTMDQGVGLGGAWGSKPFSEQGHVHIKGVVIRA